MYIYFVKANKHVINEKIENDNDNGNVNIFFYIVDGIENFDKQSKFSTTIFFHQFHQY